MDTLSMTMTSDAATFTATVRGGHGNQKLAKARKCHGLKIMDGVMDLPRKPSDAEHEAVLGRLTSALGAMPSDTDVQTWLGAELVAAIAAMKSTSASAPSPRRTVAEPRKLAAGPGSALGAYELKFASEHWRLHHPSWSEGVTVNHNRKASVREQHRVRELLGRLLAAYVPAPCRGREEARELLEITLLRLQLRDPQQLSLNKFMESSPTHLWFTVDSGAATLSDDKGHLLEPSLLDEERWLEDNELLALAARVMLGSTLDEVRARLSDPLSSELPVSSELRDRLAKEKLPVPRRRAAQLVVLAGGAPAMGFLDGAIATAGFAECFSKLAPAVALDGVVSNTAAREYFELSGPDDDRGIVRCVPPTAYVRCVAAKVECFHGCDSSYVDQSFVPMLQDTHRATGREPPRPRGSLEPPAPPARAQRNSSRISGQAHQGVAMDAAPSFAAAAAKPGHDWAAGTFHALLGRELMDNLRAAETLRAAICAAIDLFVLLSNAYNTDGIELALGAGTARFLNAHATVFADRKPHYWRAKLLKVVAPLAAGAPSDPIRFVITDAIPISQKRCPKGGKDEGLPIARLYAAGCAEEDQLEQEGEEGAEEGGEGCGDVAEGAAGSTGGGKQKEAAAKADLRKVLNAKAVPDARVRRSLRPDVPIAHFGTGAGWDDDFDRFATGLSGRPRLLAPFLAKNEKVSVAALEPCIAVAEFRTFGGGYQGKGKHVGELGTFALVRATKGGGVIMYAAASLGRELGLRDSIFSGLRNGEYPGTTVMLGPGISALAPAQTATAAAVRRLSSVAAERSPVRSPRLLTAGGLVDLASLYRTEGFKDDAAFVDELAKVQTESGIIWVLAASIPRVLQLAKKGIEEKEVKGSGKSGKRNKPAASSSSSAPAAEPVPLGLAGTFNSARLHLYPVAKKQKVAKAESTS